VTLALVSMEEKRTQILVGKSNKKKKERKKKRKKRREKE